MLGNELKELIYDQLPYTDKTKTRAVYLKKLKIRKMLVYNQKIGTIIVK